MTAQLPPSLTRLAAANPVSTDERRGLGAPAQAQLERIIATPRERTRRGWLARRGRPGGAIVVLIALLAGGGVALAVADPFGFWHSSTPDTARFAVNPANRVLAPSAEQLACHLSRAALLHCVPGADGIRYLLISRASAGAPAGFDRASALRALARARASGTLSVVGDRRLLADIAAVPASFFTSLSELGRFQTMQTGTYLSKQRELVPPHHIPILIVCRLLGRTIACSDLNGDEEVPLGAGIYAAVPSADWIAVPAPPLRDEYAASERLIVAVLGHPFTAAELRLIIDLGRYGTVTHSSAPGGGRVQEGKPVAERSP
jgi:hypothetical protein